MLGREDIVTQAGTPAVVSSFEDAGSGTQARVFTYLLEPNILFRMVFF